MRDSNRKASTVQVPNQLEPPRRSADPISGWRRPDLDTTERMIYNIDRDDPEVLMQSQDVTERQESDLTSADLSAVTDDAQFREVLGAAAEGGPICRSKRGVEALDYDTIAARVG